MPPRPTGQVVERERASGTVYGLRFRAGGQRQYVTLGSHGEGWTRSRAETELQNVLADVRRGIWKAPGAEPEPAAERSDIPPVRYGLAAGAPGRVARINAAGLRMAAERHLLPFFQRHRLSQITAREVDRYRAHKVKQGKLSATSINKTITRLAQILEVAVEYGMLDRNPARGKRGRSRRAHPRRYGWTAPSRSRRYWTPPGNWTGRPASRSRAGRSSQR